jgi:type I restriction enzyme M protein
MLLRTIESDPGRDLSQNIKLGSTLSNDLLSRERFHYCIANPPFGKNWEKDEDEVKRERREKSYSGRFGPGTPRISDGSMLFLLHLVSKFEKPENGGGRGAIVLSGSPLFTGDAGSGESEIRRWLLENDMVEAIIALPTSIFFRTSIAAYLWILTNNKYKSRKGKVQLVNAVELAATMKKSEGNKRKEISSEQIRQIADSYSSIESNGINRVLDYRTFGFRQIRILRPLRIKLHFTPEYLEALKEDKVWKKLSAEQQEAWNKELTDLSGKVYVWPWAEYFKEITKKNPQCGKMNKVLNNAFIKYFGEKDPKAEPVCDEDGNFVADPDLTDYENVPLLYDGSIDDYFAKEVLPHTPDAYIDAKYIDEKDNKIGKVGYTINFNRFFYKYVPPRKLEKIDADLKKVEAEITRLLGEL